MKTIKTSNQLLDSLPKELQNGTETEIHAALVHLKQVVREELLKEMKKRIAPIIDKYFL